MRPRIIFFARHRLSDPVFVIGFLSNRPSVEALVRHAKPVEPLAPAARPTMRPTQKALPYTATLQLADSASNP